MIILLHNNQFVTQVEYDIKQINFNQNSSIAKVILDLSQKYPDEIIVWCHEEFKAFLAVDLIENLFHHQNFMFSFNSSNGFFNKNIGFVEESPFINFNKTITFPTWQMSSCVGAIHSNVLSQLKNFKCDSNFDYYLNSIAKALMPKGLICYSEPKLLTKHDFENKLSCNNFLLFKFVKQHFKTRWIFLLFLNFAVYKRNFPIFPFFFSLFFKNRMLQKFSLEKSLINLDSKTDLEQSIDVLIPTIGRKKYLHDFLKNLNSQTLLPKNVIIVEQNPLKGSVSELDFITTEKWNFNIKHTFTNQAGACNARNIAINQTESFWAFLADDDIKIESDFLQNVIEKLQISKTNAATINCHLENEKQIYNQIIQWSTFGSGCSFVKTSELKKCIFKKGFEFGFGEDADFGMQLRNLGNDVLYFPTPKILHFKAPIGGFRTKPILKWQNELIQPKPSPTVMLYKLLHNSNEQILGYKTVLFFKFYKHQKLKNPFAYFKNFQKQWNQSLFWANELKKV